jgi:hypothetical protein
MGMFDTVICEYPLPLPNEAKELKSPPNWDKVEFQTKSMGGFMEAYTIEDDGQIYKDVLERDYEIDEHGDSFIHEKNNGIEKVEFTGDLVFYTSHTEDEYDYWVEFSALFWKGELKEINLKEWKREDNSGRVEAREKMLEAVAEQKRIKNSKIYKIKELFKKPVRAVFYVIKFILGLIVRAIWWLERRLQ